MKKSNRYKILLFCVLINIFILISSITIVLAEKTQSNNRQQITTQQPSLDNLTTHPTPPITSQQTTVRIGQTSLQTAIGKFRAGPTIKIMPLNDMINKSADGIIELYFDNPSLNDVPLAVDLHISVPSGIHIYGQGFGDAIAAGVLFAKFEVPPGTVRTAYINIKSEKTGDFFVQFSGLYFPGTNKDLFQPLSLSYPFTVYEPSPDPNSAKLTNPKQVPVDVNIAGASWFSDKILPAILIAVVAGLIGLVYKIIELKYQHKLQTDSKTTKSKTTDKEGKTTEHETTETRTTEDKSHM